MSKISTNSASPLSMASGLWRNRALVMQLARREVTGRYKGSWLGLAWSFVNPVLMLIIYTFFFSVVFKARWNLPGYDDKGGFAIVLFVGLIIHGFFAECINRSPWLILGNTNYVKRIIFPLEVLPCVTLCSALFHVFVNFIVLLIAQAILTHEIHLTAIFFPLVLLPLLLMTAGISWALASMGVFVRDIGQLTVFAVTVLQFLSPIFYPMSALPERYQSWLKLNPLTFIIEQARSVVIMGNLPDFSGVLSRTLLGLLVAWIGFWWFQKTRKGFADVL